MMKLENLLLNSLYKISLEKKTTKFIEIIEIHQIYYRISYTKNQDFANLMKIMIKFKTFWENQDFSSIKLSFVLGFFPIPQKMYSPEPHPSNAPGAGALRARGTKNCKNRQVLGLLHGLLMCVYRHVSHIFKLV